MLAPVQAAAAGTAGAGGGGPRRGTIAGSRRGHDLVRVVAESDGGGIDVAPTGTETVFTPGDGLAGLLRVSADAAAAQGREALLTHVRSRDERPGGPIDGSSRRLNAALADATAAIWRRDSGAVTGDGAMLVDGPSLWDDVCDVAAWLAAVGEGDVPVDSGGRGRASVPLVDNGVRALAAVMARNEVVRQLIAIA